MMKIKDGFLLKEMAGSYVVVPVGDNLVDFSAMVTINETGAFLWNRISDDVTINDLCDMVMAEYEGAERAEVEADVSDFIDSLKKAGILE